jgi:hypothetical protein
MKTTLINGCWNIEGRAEVKAKRIPGTDTIVLSVGKKVIATMSSKTAKRLNNSIVSVMVWDR